jgi:hypothetical protein
MGWMWMDFQVGESLTWRTELEASDHTEKVKIAFHGNHSTFVRWSGKLFAVEFKSSRLEVFNFWKVSLMNSIHKDFRINLASVCASSFDGAHNQIPLGIMCSRKTSDRKTFASPHTTFTAAFFNP